jgi:D-glucosaminate-6-phosphate ammonia-lyase
MKMQQPPKVNIFERLNVKPVINACGIYTDLGGSVLSPSVWSGKGEMNGSFVRMPDLLDKTGEVIAQLVGAESARVVPGASAALALGAAACMAGMAGPNWEHLPNTTGMRNEILVQHHHRYKYDRCVRLSGAQLVEVGDSKGTLLHQIAASVSPRTAAILIPAHLDGKPGTVPIEALTPLAQDGGISTLVDAAYLSDPPERMKTFTAAGADLVCFSAKYFWGPNAGGFICGRKRLIEIVSGIDFTNFESGLYRTFGRAFKLDRQIVVGVLLALEEWINRDHKKRWEGYSRSVHRLAQQISHIPGITRTPMYFAMDERLLEKPVNCLVVDFDARSDKNANDVRRVLLGLNPSIATIALDGRLVVAMDTVLSDQEDVLAQGLKRALVA